MKKPIAKLLVLAMLASMTTLYSCGNNADETTVDTKAPITDTQTETESETLYELDDLPSDLNYGGKTVTTYGWSDYDMVEFYAEEENGEIVNDAVFQRNLKVEERLNVTLEYRLEPGSNPNRESWVKTISQGITAGDGAYDIAGGYSMCGASLAVANMLIDLNSLDYLNFNKPWWPQSLQSEATCGGKLYFCSGDISTYMIYYLYGMYFNKQMIEDYALESPYDLVNEGKWTLDKMISMSEGVYQDVNGDGKKDVGDVYGFDTYPVYIDPFYFGAGLRTTEKDENDIPVIAECFGGEKTHDVLITLVDFFKTNDAWLEKSDVENTKNIFMEGRALFANNELQYAVNYLRASELDYGVVPMPKYDEEQQEYYTVMSFPYTLYGVPVDAGDPNMSAAVLEALASESYRTVSPALFETAFKAKYAQDDKTAQMFDLIRSSAVFDFGRVFNDSMQSMTYSLFRDAVSSGNTNWISTYQSKEKALDAALKKVVDALLGE